jgi:ferredoxin/flavodoxin---NADP+ reductase
MYRICEKNTLAADVELLVVEAPLVAKKAAPGQFVLVRVDEFSERTPLTIADFDRSAGTITLVVQCVGKSTRKMCALKAGESFQNLTGPLGTPTHIQKYGTTVIIGGGIGIAPAYPVARGMKEHGNKVISIIGARTKSLIFWEDKMGTVSDELYVTTDDGSYGTKGLVTAILSNLIKNTVKPDFVFAVGPVPMMRAVAETTRPYNILTMVSLNPIMVDGTGMCGGCRVSVGGETKFACVDGPEFDAHKVNFDELVQRQRFYKENELHAKEKCKLVPPKDSEQKANS